MGTELLEKMSDVTADLPAIRITRQDIKNHFCQLATEQEVTLGLAIVKSLKLNPFLREVHFIKYDQKSKMAIVVGYEVYLKRAERTGKLDGWVAGINTAENYSWVKIWRKDWKEPFEWQVNLSEFNKKQSTWTQIPSFMSRKVAIAQGFRLCFPDELGGMPYTQEEHEVYDIEGKEANLKPEVRMPQAIENKAEAPNEAEKTPPAASGEAKTTPSELDSKNMAIEELAKIAFKGKSKEWLNFLGYEYGCEKVSELTEEQITKITKSLNEMIKNGKK